MAAMLGWGLLGSGILSSMGASAQQSAMTNATNAALDWQRKFNRPVLQARKFLAGRIGKTSPLIRSQFKSSLQELSRSGQTQKRRSKMYWGSTGNVGRGRGEQLRLEDDLLRERNSLSMQYAANQEQFAAAPANALLGASVSDPTSNYLTRGQSAAGPQIFATFSSLLSQYTSFMALQQIMKSKTTPTP